MPQHLKDHSLKQLNSQYLAKLTPEELLHLSTKLLHDLKEAREQLNQNSSNSSKPPSSRHHWETVPTTPAAAEAGTPKAEAAEAPDTSDNPASVPTAAAPKPAKRKAGKQPGSPGYGRVWHPPIDDTAHHRVSHCEACGRALATSSHQPYTAYDSVDVRFGSEAQPGLTVITTRHHLYDSTCTCGHCTRYIPHRAIPDAGAVP